MDNSGNPEQIIGSHLDQATAFMAQHGIEAAASKGKTRDGKSYESVTFFKGASAVGQIVFVEGRPQPTTPEEAARRLKVSGFMQGVVRPVVGAVMGVYAQQPNGGILDERLDRLFPE